MRVKEIMHHVVKIPFWSSVSEAARIMDEKSIGSVLIEENGRVIGIMTEKDILRKIVAKGKNPDKVKVKDIMNDPVITIDANEDILEASKIMDEKRIRRLIVVENGQIAGKITANSISRNLKYMIVREPQVYTRMEY
ncbi:CBS domain-containing protein [Candidatus Woesearchaeota archaeon]|nr:CBS domain-containing protein [Candidatus Woesearchaeota archaeon]